MPRDIQLHDQILALFTFILSSDRVLHSLVSREADRVVAHGEDLFYDFIRFSYSRVVAG
jgi:hypothetical protein